MRPHTAYGTLLGYVVGVVVGAAVFGCDSCRAEGLANRDAALPAAIWLCENMPSPMAADAAIAGGTGAPQ
ncbi:MAG: hypothetical protein V4739_04715 [Pseudomonadota bacterium]